MINLSDMIQGTSYFSLSNVLSRVGRHGSRIYLFPPVAEGGLVDRCTGAEKIIHTYI